MEDNSKPTQEELQAVLEELFDRATLHNEHLQKQLAHVRSRVVQLMQENMDLGQANTMLSNELVYSRKINKRLEDQKDYYRNCRGMWKLPEGATEIDEQNDM